MPASISDEHGTPEDLFFAMAEEFGPFTVDCASDWKFAKCSRFISPEMDALDRGTLWGGPDDRGWLNPPYGEHGYKTRKFAYKSVGEIHRGLGLLVALMPVKSSATWWHENVMVHAVEIRLIKGRLIFVGENGPEENGAPGGHAIIVYRNGHTGGPTWYSADKLGRIISVAQPEML